MEIREHELWKLLERKSEGEKAAEQAFEEAVWQVCGYGITLSKTIRDTFQTYTLHDETHICNVMTIMLKLLGNLKDCLTKEECAMLIMSACCHDIGMSASEEEKEYLRSCPDCMQEYLDKHPGDYTIAYQGGADENAQITEEILQHYIRANHHSRVSEQLQNIQWPAVLGHSMNIEELIAVCQSHGEEPSDIRRLQRFAPNLDLYLCAVLLRLGDILDFDATRAPDELYRYINLARLDGMENKISRLEWDKHQASRGFTFVQDEQCTLLYRAECSSIQVERAIVDYLDWVDKELTACGKLIRYMESRWRSLMLPGRVEKQITARGYLSGEYTLTLDQDRVLDLLVGRELYSDPAVFVRELIQNAIDAVRTRRQMDKNLPRNWKPQINIRTWVDDEGYYWFRIEDNGIGMTEETIQKYFLKIGHSYYNSDQFRADKIRCGADSEYKPISRFGIGLLSCFMGDPKNNQVEVTTKHFMENGVRHPAYRLSIKGINGYYYLANDTEQRTTATEMPDCPKKGERFISAPGTVIAVRSNPYQSGGAQSFKDIIDRYVLYPEIPVHYEGIEGVCDYRTEQEFMDAVHEITPYCADGDYQPVQRIYMPEKDLQQFQQRYPEVVWEEKPSIAVYCLPVDYFTGNPLIKGACAVIRAEGKGIWKAEGLNKKYMPEIELFILQSVEDALGIKISFGSTDDLEEDILPVLKSQLKQQGIELYGYNAYDIMQRFSSEKFRGLSQQEVRAGLSTQSEYESTVFAGTLGQFSWYQSWLSLDKQDGYDKTFVHVHNGVVAGSSGFSLSHTNYTERNIILFKDKYCPNLNLSRNRIQNWPLETVCSLTALAAYMDRRLKRYGTFSDMFHREYHRFSDRAYLASVQEYWEVLERNPSLLPKLLFWIDSGAKTLSEIELIMKTQDQVILLEEEAFHMAVLLQRFDVKIASIDRKGISICLKKKSEDSALGGLLDFPPALFLPPSTNNITSLSNLYDGYNYRDRETYNSAHPFSGWLIQNQSLLQRKVPGIYRRMIRYLKNGGDIIKNMNAVLSQLRQIPHLGIEVYRDLTRDDFFIGNDDEP